MPDNVSSADFIVRIPARFLKDARIPPDAKALRAVLGAYADGRTGCAYVRPNTLQEVLGWSRYRREAAQRALVRAGWLRMARKPAGRGRFGQRIYVLAQPPAAAEPAIARIHHSGEIEHYIH